MTVPSPAIEDGAQTYHPFPPPSVLAKPEVSAILRKLGFGYRAEFIQKTAKMLTEAHGLAQSSTEGMEPAEKWLLTLRTLPTAQAREELLKLMGVGRKVADCILLMSLDKVMEIYFSDFFCVDVAADGSGARRHPRSPDRREALWHVRIFQGENGYDSQVV